MSLPFPSQGDSPLGSYIIVLFPVAFLGRSDLVWLMHWSFKHPCSLRDAAALVLFPTDQLSTAKKKRQKGDLTALPVLHSGLLVGTLVSVPLIHWISPCVTV